MQALQTIVEFAFARYALGAAIAVGLVCSLLSVIVVLKRMAFIGQGISHAGFGGVGTAAALGLAGLAQDVVILIFCLGAAFGIGLFVRTRKVAADTAIGIVLAATMAWGVLMQNLRVMLQSWPPYRAWVGTMAYVPPWESILFGSLLDVGPVGMWAAIILCLIVIAVCAAVYKELIFFTFDETVSRTFGVPAGPMHYLLLVMLALVVVVSIKLVGFILVTALLIVPGASALVLSRRMSVVLVLAAAIGLTGTVGGLLISLELGEVSSGACIVLLLFAMFLAANAWGRLRRAIG